MKTNRMIFSLIIVFMLFQGCGLEQAIPTEEANKSSISTGWKVLSDWKISSIGRGNSGVIFRINYETTFNEPLISQKVVSDGIINVYMRAPKIDNVIHKVGYHQFQSFIFFGQTATRASISRNSLKEGSIKIELIVDYPSENTTPDNILKIIEADKLEIQMNMIIPKK